jgi:hypothetical protein
MNLYQSINKTFKNNKPNLLVSENSELQENETTSFCKDNNIEYISSNGRRTHSEGVRELIPKIKTKWGLLVDTDIIFRANPEDLIDKMEKDDCVICGYTCGNRGGKLMVSRVHPWFMIFNADICKKENFRFDCQGSKHEDPNIEYLEPLFPQNKGKIYDAGSRFLEEIVFKGYKFLSINSACKNENDTPWYFHFEGLSWFKEFNDNPYLQEKRKLSHDLIKSRFISK